MRHRSMLGWARRIAVVTMVLGLGLVCAPGATAGGTTSVLLTSPSSGEAAALTGPAKYGALEALVGSGEGALERPRSLDGAMGLRQINVTWMAHDVSPVRLDRLFPGNEPDTLWIHTMAGLPDTSRGAWHRAERPRELAALLKELGLMGPVAEGAAVPMFSLPGEDEEVTATRADESGAAAAADAAPAPADSGSLLDGWWWVIPGLLMGAVIALSTRRRGGGRELGPRRQLLDL